MIKKMSRVAEARLFTLTQPNGHCVPLHVPLSLFSNYCSISFTLIYLLRASAMGRAASSTPSSAVVAPCPKPDASSAPYASDDDIGRPIGRHCREKMNPGDFPESNSPGDRSPMFGGDAHWPGSEPPEYRSFDTPGSVQSNWDPNTQFDPEFTTESYGLSDMEPSPAPAPKERKKRTKVRAQKLPPPEVNEEYAPGRTNYSPEETVLLTQIWVDISEDPLFSNNQRVTAYWERIAARYNAKKPAASWKRTKEQLRKHWDQVKKQLSLFSAEYTKCFRDQRSGESLTDVRDRALASYVSMYGEFKHYNSWLVVKDKQKFQGGIMPAGSASKRTKNTVSGEYTSSDGGAPQMDLNQTAFEDESSGTPMSVRRPIGNKAAKNKGKAKATSSQNPESAPAPGPPSVTANVYGDLVEVARQRMLLDTFNALQDCQDPVQAQVLKKLIEKIQRQLGMD